MAGAVLRFLDYFDSVSGREIPCVPFRRDRGKTSWYPDFCGGLYNDHCPSAEFLAGLAGARRRWDVGRCADAGPADVGSEGTLAFYGAEGTVSLTVPVPEGLVPAELTGVVEIPVNMATGTLTVAQDDRTLSRTVLPNTDQVPITIPLSGVSVVDNAITVILRSYLVPIEGYCLDPANPLRLINADVRFVGMETAPRTIADFLPPVLEQLTIFLRRTPSRAESDAAIRLSTAVAAH